MHIPEVSPYELQGFDSETSHRTRFFTNNQEPPLFAVVNISPPTKNGTEVNVAGPLTGSELYLNHVTFTVSSPVDQDIIADQPLSYVQHEERAILKRDDPELINHAAQALAAIVLAEPTLRPTM